LGSPAATGYESNNYLRLVVSGQSAVGNFGYVGQRVEDVRTFAGETVTVSFWAKAASGTPKIGVELGQWFGTGGSPSAEMQNAAGAVTISTSWTRYSLTYTLPTLSGKTLGTNGDHFLNLVMWCSAGSTYGTRSSNIGTQNNTFDIWGVQVERGSYATPFEVRVYQQELAMCQRYYYRINGRGAGIGFDHWGVPGAVAATNNANRFGMILPVVPRRIITISDFSSTGLQVYDGGGPYALTITSLYHAGNSTSIGFDGTGTGLAAGRPCIPLFSNTGTPYIAINVEL